MDVDNNKTAVNEKEECKKKEYKKEIIDFLNKQLSEHKYEIKNSKLNNVRFDNFEFVEEGSGYRAIFGYELLGRKEGKWIGWYKRAGCKSESFIGNKSYEIDFFGGKKEGKFIIRHDNGNKMCEGQFVNDLAEGLWYYWNYDGYPEPNKVYKEGNLVRNI